MNRVGDATGYPRAISSKVSTFVLSGVLGDNKLAQPELALFLALEAGINGQLILSRNI